MSSDQGSIGPNSNNSRANGNGEHKASILLVDDEYDIVKLISRSLQRYDVVKVCAFTDAIEALQHFSSNSNSSSNDYHHHSLVISDIRMPSMNGYEFVKQIKKIDSQAKIILMSAFEIEDKEFRNVLPDIKVDGFLQKPFSLNELKSIVYEKIIQ
ncbi:MAG TPA: response regulator [Nitrososphaeraceae archaeon]|nr:response regulator [Nitrososphaeraceae archaeon]